MSYLKYQTEAIMLAAFPSGEADRVYTLYTSEFGLVRARATGVRKEASKMRSSLVSCGRAYLSLVRGKGGWRAAGASSALSPLGCDGKGIRAFARLGALVERLVVPEERSEELYAIVRSAQDVLVQRTVPQWATIEVLSAARVLHALGYLSAEGLGVSLIAHTLYDDAFIMKAAYNHDALLESVNRALSETQL